jgi:murein DD-endopeptidase MepM/ murein hydrolase activator NlpD
VASGPQLSWTPPPVPGQGDPATPIAPTQQPNAVSSWLDEQWAQQVQGAQNVGWMFQWGYGKVFPSDPEGDLAKLIFQKMGGGSVAGREGVNPNWVTARETAHAAMNDPNYRQQLATAMGWNQNNPHVSFWIKSGGGPPADPLGTGLPPGTPAPPTTAPPAAVAAASAASPFPASAWKGRANDPGFTYGALLPPAIAAAAGVPRQWGVDYMLPQGTPLNAPFSGKITEADFNGPYGNTVVITMANGYTYRVAHLEGMNVKVGDAVTVGQQLGAVGSTGNSTGPHVLIEMRDSSGKPIDPTPIVDSLLKGDTSSATKILGDYQTAGDKVGPGSGNAFLTSDGHLVYPGSDAYNVYSAAQQVWHKRYGGDPPWTFVSGLIAAGNTTISAIQSAMDQMSSDIPGLKWGARDALTNDANNAALKAWDRPVPDSTIKQLAAQGITTPGQIQGWILSHPASSLDKTDYKTIFDGANPQTQELWQQPPSPDLVRHIHDQMNRGPA